MEFRVLGDLTVLTAGRALPLASRRQEQLLALLISRGGRVVDAGTLTDALWAERLGSQAAKNLQVLVHRLRRTLGDAERIRHDRYGYALLAETEEVDAWHFAELAERGGKALAGNDAKAATALLAEALALWRGPAFSGLDDVIALSEAAERLEQMRRRAVTERIDAELRLGRHGALVPELMGLAAADPLDESVTARLMMALSGSGRRTEALAVYRRTRTVLAEELGLEPGPELRRLQRAVLRGDADVAPARRSSARWGGAAVRAAEALQPDPAPCLLPASVADLTGRDAELRHLVRTLGGLSPSTPVVCAISGMAGVGKTALAVRAAHEVRKDFPDGQLYVNLHGAGARPVEPRETLGRFLRALGVPGAGIPDTLDERAEVYRARLSGRRVLVVLDDAADEAQVEPLLPADAGSVCLVTSRAALTALAGADRLALGTLPVDAAVDLLGTITGRDDLDGATARRLAELCGRLPLALRIAGARLAARPHWSAERLAARLETEHDRLDELAHGALSVRASLALGYSGLADPARTLLRRLGLVETPEFAGWVAAALLDAAPRAAEDTLESLLDARFVEYAGLDGVGVARYRLHDLVRLHAKERAAEEEGPGEADAALARLTGAYLALAERAHRRQYGGDYLILHGGAERWQVDPETESLLLGDPAGWLRGERQGLVAAVDQAARLGLAETCWDLALTAVTLFDAQGLYDDWLRTCSTALEVARKAGDVRGEAAMRFSLGELDLFRQRYGAARPHFDAALALFTEAGDRHGEALTVRNAALLDRVEGRVEVALDRYGHALDLLREVGDLSAEAHVLGSVAQIHIEHGSAEEAGPLLETAVVIYRDLGDVRGTAQILNRMGAAHLREGRAAEAEAAYRQVTESTRAAGDRIGEAYGLLGLGEARLLAGGHDGAAEALDAALLLATEVAEPFVAARARLAAGRLAAAAGDAGTARALLEEADRGFQRIGLPVWHERAADALRALPGGRSGQQPPSA
ncbi:SARP family transcriptional regulator [Acrocarpospora phusangensis]|uniref:SARP family transcriptional regulator n=1 Tax=Acrocarpospora phusangensis TaxID=1070424 RepID=A0A919Q8T4_9ACTN|nr:AfsR/SARP family transcriptional regulator [Acrocarpospora phusangensis]GIH22785.1 SARP family transcriptional regulator [Acrocarpospora phusangensis]